MAKSRDPNELLELIAGAALDESQWPAVLYGVAQALGAGRAALIRQDQTTGAAGQAISVNHDPAAARQYLDYYSQRNPLRGFSEIDDAYGRRAVTVRPEVHALMLQSELYNDFYVPNDTSIPVWIFLDRNGANASVLNISRSLQQEPFEAADLERFTALMPHIMRAYAISRRLGGIGTAGHALPRYLDMLPHGVVLLDAFGRIMHANAAATALAATGDGIVFTRDGLAASMHEADRRLQTAIAVALARDAERPTRALLLPRRSGKRPLAVVACGFDDPAADVFGRPSVLVEIRDLAAEPADATWLADALDLTPAEARVAVLLLEGLDRDAIAGRLGISGNTARVHLARLMSKTGTHRQAELVLRLERIAALQRRTAPAP